MKFLVISDNHGDRDILVKVFEAYQHQVDAIFHCGDSEMAADDSLFDHVVTVAGNNDYQGGFKDDQLVNINNESVFLTHGDRYGVNMGLTHLSLKAQEVDANFCFYGHTHQLAVEQDHGCIYLNPGSISLPRGEFASLGGTFAVIEVNAAQVTVDYFDRQLRQVPGLHIGLTR